MNTPCTKDGCDGLVDVGWEHHMEIVACPACGFEYRVWGDETWDERTNESHDWWAITLPDDEDPWGW